MSPNYMALRQELKHHLIDSGLTYSPEQEALGVPVTIREQSVEHILNTLLDYMIGKDYVQVS